METLTGWSRDGRTDYRTFGLEKVACLCPCCCCCCCRVQPIRLGLAVSEIHNFSSCAVGCSLFVHGFVVVVVVDVTVTVIVCAWSIVTCFPYRKRGTRVKREKGGSRMEWNGMGLSAKWREEKETQYLIVYYCFVCCCRIVTDWPTETVSWTVRRITIWLALRRTRRTRFSASVASSSPATTRISTLL